jgi:nucleoside-diphosphate-sugar epimerase
MSERWLITGAGGFIGRRLSEKLEQSGIAVTAWRRRDADLTRPGDVARAMPTIVPTHVVHLAAMPANPHAEDWRAIADEAAMVGNLAAAIPEECRLLCTGSMAEFGRAGVFDEAAPCRPRTLYGAAKNAATDRALALRQLSGRRIGVARLFGVYGPGERPERLLPHVAAALAQGRAVPLSAGDQRRDFIHVDDVCSILIAIARAPTLPPLVNVGTGIGVTVRRVCEAIADVLGAPRELLRFGERPYRNVDESELVADTRLLAQYAAVPPQRWLDPSSLKGDILAAALAKPAEGLR